MITDARNLIVTLLDCLEETAEIVSRGDPAEIQDFQGEIEITLNQARNHEGFKRIRRYAERLDNADAPWHPGWSPPTSAQIRETLRERALTGAAAGRVCGVDSRTVRRWTGGETPIPYAAWRTLVLEG